MKESIYLLTGFMPNYTSTSKNSSIGGRGKKAPYQTKLTRIPLALKSTVESLSSKYRELVGEFEDDSALLAAVTDINQKQKAEIILKALEFYIQYRSQNYRPTLKPVDTNTRGWDELRKFTNLIENDPEKLLR